MKEEKTEDKKSTGKAKPKRQESAFPLPYCTTAADPEHQRAEQEDEPCDDARAEEFGQEQEAGADSTSENTKHEKSKSG